MTDQTTPNPVTLKIEAVAEALTSITGNGWTWTEWAHNYGSSSYHLLRSDAPALEEQAEIFIRVDTDKGKAEACGSLPDKLKAHRPYNGTVNIGFSMAREAAALAADIQRRLLVQWYPMLRKIVQSARQEDQRDRSLNADTSHLETIATFPVTRRTWHERDSHRKLYFTEPTRGEIEIDRYQKDKESRVKITLDHLTPAQAEQIIYMLNTWK